MRSNSSSAAQVASGTVPSSTKISGPAALVLRLEDLALETYFRGHPGVGLVRDRPHIQERLVRRDSLGKGAVLHRAVRLLDHAGPAGAFGDRVQHAQADPGAQKLRACPAVHPVTHGAVRVPL